MDGTEQTNLCRRLFDYAETRDAFHIPHKMKILLEMFKPPDGDWAHRNAYRFIQFEQAG